MAFSCRRLPHAYPRGQWLCATWHLHVVFPHGRYPPPDKASAAKTGLVGRVEDYPWSSANQQERLDTIVETADTSVRATD
ncbi:MAG TPA: hypothetical protein VH325_07820 [Bryobacteraceae bacterium]|nr:hypothetical protein [Bryobacteraceae bacterium]